MARQPENAWVVINTNKSDANFPTLIIGTGSNEVISVGAECGMVEEKEPPDSNGNEKITNYLYCQIEGTLVPTEDLIPGHYTETAIQNMFDSTRAEKIRYAYRNVEWTYKDFTVIESIQQVGDYIEVVLSGGEKDIPNSTPAQS